MRGRRGEEKGGKRGEGGKLSERFEIQQRLLQLDYLSVSEESKKRGAGRRDRIPPGTIANGNFLKISTTSSVFLGSEARSASPFTTLKKKRR